MQWSGKLAANTAYFSPDSGIIRLILHQQVKYNYNYLITFEHQLSIWLRRLGIAECIVGFPGKTRHPYSS